jgi:hypothetical protein
MEQKEVESENKPVKSVAEFVEMVLKKSEKFRPHHELNLWFRGEGSVDYELIPNIYRRYIYNGMDYCLPIRNTSEFYRLEQNIDSSFQRKASIFFAKKGIENKPWNRYFLKQHYGIKTRLLDWTENSLIALFFSVLPKESTENKNSRVYILSPFVLNNSTVSNFSDSMKNFYGIFSVSELEKPGDLETEDKKFRTAELFRRYYRLDCKGEKLNPIAIYPQHLDERMSAQQAVFTLFGNVQDGLDKNVDKDKFLDSILIDAKSKTRILQELRFIGITHYSIYPDLDGLGRAINYDHFKDIDNVQSNNDFDTFFNLPDS